MTSPPFPNQPPPYGDRNLFGDDAPLREAVRREGAGNDEAGLAAFGALLGRADTLALGDAANRHPPELQTFDARGERIDEIVFHPAWDALMQIGKEAGEHCAPWVDAMPGAQVARAARVILHAQVENGTQCPLTMTFASIPVLRRHGDAMPELASIWLPRLLTRVHDPRPLPMAVKHGGLIGMGMTERQGGSDVRSNRTRATPSADGSVRITGHKWFFSVPQSDAHLVIAQSDAGIGCFLLPRILGDGTRNAIRINRLKDKLGNRSNASAEVEFDGALGWPIGEPGQGIATILEMVRYTRLDCVLGSVGIMRAALARAVHHARHRIVFGHAAAAQPLMATVLADLALEVEASTALALRLARAFEAPEGSADRAFARLVTPAAKFWVCKRGPGLAAEAMEVLGGNGYVEASGLPRLYRELPVNSIWEGSGNVMCLEVLRIAQREPQAMEAAMDELSAARGEHRTFDAAVQAFEQATRTEIGQGDGRRLAQALVSLIQGALLLQHAPAAVGDAFCRSRLAEERFGGAVYGTLPCGVDAAALIARALPG